MGLAFRANRNSMARRSELWAAGGQCQDRL
jgi:hypothetical protein